MDRLAAPRPSPLDRAAETAAALLAIALYVVVVSRGELLPYAGPARALTAPALALAGAGLAGWRLRAPIAAAWRAGHLRRATLALGLLAVAAGLRLLAGGLARPAAPAEAAVVADAIAIIRNQAPETTDPAMLLLAWLHAPVAAACYVAGVSGGLWEGLKFIEPPVVLAWSRAVHLALSLASVGVAGLAAGRLAGARAGWLAAALLAVSPATITAASAVDPGAPGGWLTALLLLAAAPLLAGRLTDAAGWPRWALVGAALLGCGLLVPPATLMAALAPLGAVVAAWALAALRLDRARPAGSRS